MDEACRTRGQATGILRGAVFGTASGNLGSLDLRRLAPMPLLVGAF